jgi:CheY-like chemotaxis protein
MEKRDKRILVVDDERNVRDILSRMLSILGFEVAVAGTGIDALNIFLNNSIALVLTDLHMPGMDGWTLASHIKEQSPNTPIVVMTGSEKEPVIEKLKESRVDSVVFKPFTMKSIKKNVRDILDNSALK